MNNLNLCKFKKSVDRACNLLKCQNVYEKFFIVKVQPINNHSCCCDNCYPIFWNQINRDSNLLKQIQHEGDTIVEIDNVKFVLEQHESGPEFIIGVSTGIISNAIWSWISNKFTKPFSNDPKNKNGVIISVQTIKNGNLEYNSLEIKNSSSIDENVLIIINNFLKGIKK